ncbi:MAG: hypothetical protein ACYTG6_12440 [Planctomycetota bacterium]
MFKRRRVPLVVAFVLALVTLALLSGPAAANRGDGALGVVFVRSQGLYYDTFVSARELPPHGPFQLLEMGPDGPETEYGPGDRGYVGGRWKVPDGRGGFLYFLCPLLGPGRPAP